MNPDGSERSRLDQLPLAMQVVKLRDHLIHGVAEHGEDVGSSEDIPTSLLREVGMHVVEVTLERKCVEFNAVEVLERLRD